MPLPSTAFTTWVNDPGTPSVPGAADMNRIQDALKFLLNPPAAKLLNETGGSIGSGSTWTTLPWYIQDYEQENNTLVSLGTDNTKITIPYNGRWLVYAAAAIDAGTTAGYRSLRILADGATGISLAQGGQPDAGAALYLSCTYVGSLTAGTYLQVQARQTGGVPASIVVGHNMPVFTATMWSLG